MQALLLRCRTMVPLRYCCCLLWSSCRVLPAGRCRRVGAVQPCGSVPLPGKQCVPRQLNQTLLPACCCRCAGDEEDGGEGGEGGDEGTPGTSASARGGAGGGASLAALQAQVAALQADLAEVKALLLAQRGSGGVAAQ